MKILENNYCLYKIIRCKHCDSILEIEDKDIFYNENCAPNIICPVCNKKTPLKPAEYKKEIGNNIIFPEDFKRILVTDENLDVKYCEIQKLIRRGIKFLKDNPNESMYYIISGDTFILFFNKNYNEDKYDVIIGKGLFETHINL